MYAHTMDDERIKYTIDVVLIMLMVVNISFWYRITRPPA